jgi:hypothetical protein
MSTPQNTNQKTEILNLTASLKKTASLDAEAKAQLPDLLAQIHRFMPPAKPSITARPRQSSREQQEGL